MIERARFDRARAAILAARAKLDAFASELSIKYGPGEQWAWHSAAEQRKRQRLAAAYDRACDRMYALLDASPRNWRSGVPAAWVAERLTYADAVRSKDERLSEVPPCAYGCVHLMT